MVGFGSRLREQFNSVRSGSSGPGSGASASHSSKNIRGLTRLGGGSDGGGGGAPAATAAPLELPSNTPLGRSKVAVWGTGGGGAAEEPSAPSGHLASVKLGSTPPAAGTSPPRQPVSSEAAPRSPSKPRWGDVDDDDDDSDDGRDRGNDNKGQTAREGGSDASRGNGSWRDRPGDGGSPYGTSPARYNDPDRGGGRFHDSYRGGGRYNSYNDPDRGGGGRYGDQYPRGEGRYNHSSYHDQERGGGGGGRQYGDDRRSTHSDHFGSFGGGDRGQYRERGHRYDSYDRGYEHDRGGRYGRDQYGTHDRPYGHEGGATESHRWERGLKHDAAAPVSERFGGGGGSYHERRSFDESGGGREAPSPRAALSKKAEEPPRTLLRSTDAAPAAPTKVEAEGGAKSPSLAGEATQLPRAGASASTAGRLEKLGGPGAAAARPPNPWTAQPTSAAAAAVSPARGEDASAPAVGILPPVAETAPPPRTQEEIEQDKQDRARRQQMSILQHVAERRARASSASSREGKKSSAAEEKEAASPGRPAAATRTLERKKSADAAEDPEQRAERRKGAKAKAKSDRGGNPCRVEGHDHDWKDCPRNPKSDSFVARDKPPKAKKSKAKSDGGQHNPCRIEGHDHDWTDCPSNPKSGSFVRDNPCRIEGHDDHDWSDCRDNPKSANYVKPSGRGKGKKSKGKKKASSKGSVPEVPDKSDRSENGASEDAPGPRSEGDMAIEKSKAQPKEEPGAIPSANASEKPPPEEKKPFAPAPPPKVSAWVTGPPPAVTHIAPSLAPPSAAPGLSSPMAPTPAHASSEAAAMTSQPLNTQMPQLDYGQQRQSIGIIQKPRPDALFSGNEALFGKKSDGASAPIYDSWNPPPIVLPSAAVDHWEANPFAPKPARPPSSGPRFGSILNEGAVALVPPKSTDAGPAKDAKFFRG